MNSEEIENAIKHIYSNDSRLANVIDRSGSCRIRPHNRYFIALVRSIISQQLSTKAGNAIIERFIAYYNGKPKPKLIINTPSQNLRKIGISGAKIRYIKCLSETVVENPSFFKGIKKTSDEDVIIRLTQIKGIGEWTAQMFLIFTLGRLNVLPVKDQGIINAIRKLYGLRKTPDSEKIRKISVKNKWHPYNSVACWYLWMSLEL